jgi:hypothetical protein
MDPRSRSDLRFFLLLCPASFYERRAPNASLLSPKPLRERRKSGGNAAF